MSIRGRGRLHLGHVKRREFGQERKEDECTVQRGLNTRRHVTSTQHGQKTKKRGQRGRRGRRILHAKSLGRDREILVIDHETPLLGVSTRPLFQKDQTTRWVPLEVDHARRQPDHLKVSTRTTRRTTRRRQGGTLLKGDDRRPCDKHGVGLISRTRRGEDNNGCGDDTRLIDLEDKERGVCCEATPYCIEEGPEDNRRTTLATLGCSRLLGSLGS